jgi:hypothetical protein
VQSFAEKLSSPMEIQALESSLGVAIYVQPVPHRVVYTVHSRGKK